MSQPSTATELTRAVRTLLDGPGQPELAAGNLTEPLQQLHRGLTAPAAELVVIGATAFCEAARAVPPEGFPWPVTAALAALSEQLAVANPFLRHTARVAAERLAGGAPERFVAELSATLPTTAAGEENRSRVEQLRDESPLSVRCQVTAGGRLKITVELTVPATPARDRLTALYAGVFAVVTIRVAEQASRYWVALEERRQWLAGTLDLPCPPGEFRVEADHAPVGAWGLARVPAEDLLTSLRGADNPGLRVWRGAGERLPEGHPLHRAHRHLHAERGLS